MGAIEPWSWRRWQCPVLALMLFAACTASGTGGTSTTAQPGPTTTIRPPVTTTTLPPTSVTSTTLAATTTTAPPLDLTEPLVWFAPNMASTDFVELFSEPEAWATARAEVNVFKFYSANLFPDPCEICGDISLGVLADADAFSLLGEWGKPIAIEVGAVYEGGCRGDATFEHDAGVVIDNVARSGGAVRIVAMDEPLLHGGVKPMTGSCDYTPAEAAAETAAFVAALHTAHPTIIVGDIEPYPHYSVAELQEWITALQHNGVVPAFFHLDVDMERVRVEGHDVAADLATMQRFVEDRDIVFGVILTSNWTQAGTDQAYYQSTMEWVRRVEAIGRPQHVIFQSWQGPAANGDHEVPINLPDADPETYSHTRLILEGLASLGG
ncbi:MAG: hypothetical protein WD269_09265 [Acidimicrobiia bacterium]